MYPLNMHNPASGGFAVANDEGEHKALSEAGYGPAFFASEEPETTEDAPEAPKRRGRPPKVTQEA